MQNISDIRSRESGQGMLEYILIVVLVVVAAVGAWRYFGAKTSSLVDQANQELESIKID